MVSPYKEVQLHVFDVSGVMKIITEYPFNSLVQKRIVESIDIDSYDTDGRMKQIKNSLIDDFLRNTINSFQICWVNGYSSHYNTREEQDWINHNEEARKLLYAIINLPPELSGAHIGYQRIDTAIFLAIPTA